MTQTIYNPLTTLLADLVIRGISLEVVGDRLRYRPRNRVTPDLINRVTLHKNDLLVLLAPRTQAAQMIRQALRKRDFDLAVALRNGWRSA